MAINTPRVRSPELPQHFPWLNTECPIQLQVLLQHPLGISHARKGVLWLTDTYNHKIKQIEPKTGACICFAGEGSPGLRDGITDQAQFHEPSGLSYLQNELFIADTNNHVIRRIHLRKKEVSTLRIEGLYAPGICIP